MGIEQGKGERNHSEWIDDVGGCISKITDAAADKNLVNNVIQRAH